jgi:hypothetical protein
MSSERCNGDINGDTDAITSVAADEQETPGHQAETNNEPSDVYLNGHESEGHHVEVNRLPEENYLFLT